MANNNKPHKVKFELNSKVLAMIFMCYKYKIPLSAFLSFYELYGDYALFPFKAMICMKKINSTDAIIEKIIAESQILYKEILKGSYQYSMAMSNPISGVVKKPEIDYKLFTDEYARFIRNYLLVNIDNIYATKVELKMTTTELYLKP